MDSLTVRRIFHWMDQFTMVPMLRAGLGPLIGNPFTGYMMLMKTIGRKSGQPRYTPMNYAIMNGNVYCLVRWGGAADWYRNLRAHPQVEVTLPGRTLHGSAEEVTDIDEKVNALRQVLKNGGFAGFSQGFNPFTASREVLVEKTPGMRVVRIRPDGVGTSPSDPGGWFWLVPLLGALWLVARQLGRHAS